ncbi:hypothetical protein [Bradyrhizobium sp. LHD-71]|nr:hypothetical protein [Bradyrhizobium sp. LHD-71]MDQ8726129.1 hypothetical protein [Bradyrhizobium sp. LHD-71]
MRDPKDIIAEMAALDAESAAIFSVEAMPWTGRGQLLAWEMSRLI